MALTKEAETKLNKAFDTWATRLRTGLTVEKALSKSALLWSGGPGLGAWQADILERWELDSFSGAYLERERILAELSEMSEHIPGDTVLGMYIAKVRALVSGKDAEDLEEYYSVHFEYGSDKAYVVRRDVGEVL